jgi:hypothetical protein
VAAVSAMSSGISSPDVDAIFAPLRSYWNMFPKYDQNQNGYVGVLKTLWLFTFAAQPKEFFLNGLKRLEQRSHKCVKLGGGICRVNTFFQSRSLFFVFYKAKDL